MSLRICYEECKISSSCLSKIFESKFIFPGIEDYLRKFVLILVPHSHLIIGLP